MNHAKRYMLQAKVNNRIDGNDVYEWKNVESADGKEELRALIPIGRESFFRIIDVYAWEKKDRKISLEATALFCERFNNLITGQTTSEIARKCGLTVDKIRKYKRGERYPRMESLRKLCEGLNVSAAELIGL